MNYCSDCGNPVIQEIPEGDEKLRFVCPQCHTIHYENPKIIGGTVPEHQGKILLCRRAIEPALGKWTLPAGFMENGETVTESAIRETEEEAGARLVNISPYMVVNLPTINQVYFMFRGQLADPNFKAGLESLEVKLFTPDEIPWSELAFTSMHKVLKQYCADLEQGLFPFQIIDINRPL